MGHPTAPGPYCVPFAHNPLFVGRDFALRDLALELVPEGATAAVCGAGGLGKTQLAVEYARWSWGLGRWPGGVFWLNMEQPAGVAAQVAALAGPGGLALPGFDPQAQAQNVALVRRAWQDALPRLLVLDNLEDPALLAEWRPRVGGCRVLITIRNAAWPARLGVTALPLGPLERKYSIQLLLTPRATAAGKSVLDLLAGDTAIQAADALCAELGDLPLALHLAGAYLESYPFVLLTQYRRQVDERLLTIDELLPEDAATTPTGHSPSLAATFALSYDRLAPEREIDALARTLLHRAAWCAPGVPIPRLLLLRLAALDPDGANTQAALDGALRRLASLGLIEREADGGARLHRLLAAYARSRAPDPAGDAVAL
jgi:hypothetical protein